MLCAEEQLDLSTALYLQWCTMSDVVDVDAASSVHAEEGKGKSNEGAFAYVLSHWPPRALAA